MLNKKGFTLIEIVTVMGIFTLLMGLILANLNQGKHTQELREVSQNLVTDLRDMQNTTLIGRTAGVCHIYDESDVLQSVTVDCKQDLQCRPTPLNPSWSYICEDVTPPGGYGVFFDPGQPTQYLLFGDYADNTRNGVIGLKYSYEPPNPLPNSDVLVRKINFPENISIASIDGESLFPLAGCPPVKSPPDTYWKTDSSSISLVFTQPRGSLYTTFHSQIGINDSCPDYVISILLAHDKINTCREITINGAAGLIEEKSNPSCTL